MTDRLAGKVALVTGGGRGIGAAIARRLSRDGATVAITYSASAEAAERVVSDIAAKGGQALAIRADAADPAAVTAAIDQTAIRFGHLDILVNNAGMGVAASIAEMRIEDYDRCFAVNVRAVFVAIQAAARHMERGGRIITIGSVNADRIPFAGGSVYAATKAAVAGLTRGAARDLGHRGITVNVVQPGPIDTDMNPADGPYAGASKAALALDDYGRPEDVANLVAFLAGPESDYITGATLNIDGGYCA
ncbi:MAG TPA: SDR family oxidoreductase [Alphaproteobacteria bacterium]|nr:SDR family oxidoreductase [Alphaproteobacteria bacterium]